LVLRNIFPIPVIRGSFPVVTDVPSLSALTIMERNLYKLNKRPLRPTLFCENIIGPGEEILIRNITMRKSGERMIMPIKANTISNALMTDRH
jgi:hypothetical protein